MSKPRVNRAAIIYGYTIMQTYLDWLPDVLMLKIYTHVYDGCLVELCQTVRRRNLPKHNRGTNARAVWFWMNGKPGKSGSISTDGSTLYSYTLPIGKTEGGKKLVYDYTARGEFGFVSHTTGPRLDRNVNTRGKDLNTIVTDDIILDRVSTQRLHDQPLPRYVIYIWHISTGLLV